MKTQDRCLLGPGTKQADGKSQQVSILREAAPARVGTRSGRGGWRSGTCPLDGMWPKASQQLAETVRQEMSKSGLRELPCETENRAPNPEGHTTSTKARTLSHEMCKETNEWEMESGQ